MITGICELKLLVKLISCECSCKRYCKRCNSKQIWNEDKYRCERKKIERE